MRNPICAAACVCLKQYNQRLRTGLMLLQGGVKLATLQRCHHLGLTVSHQLCIRMQEKFGDNFDEKVVSWTEQTKETEVMIRFLEEVKKQGSTINGDDFSYQASFNLSNEAVKDLPSFDKSVHKKCVNVLRETTTGRMYLL